MFCPLNNHQLRLSKKYRFYFVNEPLVNMYVQDDSISQNIKKLIDAEYLLLTKYSEEVASFPEFKYYNLTIFAVIIPLTSGGKTEVFSLIIFVN